METLACQIDIDLCCTGAAKGHLINWEKVCPNCTLYAELDICLFSLNAPVLLPGKHFEHVDYRFLQIYDNKTVTDKDVVLLRPCTPGVRKVLAATVSKNLEMNCGECNEDAIGKLEPQLHSDHQRRIELYRKHVREFNKAEA